MIAFQSFSTFREKSFLMFLTGAVLFALAPCSARACTIRVESNNASTSAADEQIPALAASSELSKTAAALVSGRFACLAELKKIAGTRPARNSSDSSIGYPVSAPFIDSVMRLTGGGSNAARVDYEVDPSTRAAGNWLSLTTSVIAVSAAPGDATRTRDSRGSELDSAASPSPTVSRNAKFAAYAK